MSAATSRTCDGCGTPGAAPLPQVPALDYCAECMPQVREFLSAVDALHSQMAAQWGTELQALREKFAGMKELPY